MVDKLSGGRPKLLFADIDETVIFCLFENIESFIFCPNRINSEHIIIISIMLQINLKLRVENILCNYWLYVYVGAEGNFSVDHEKWEDHFGVEMGHFPIEFTIFIHFGVTLFNLHWKRVPLYLIYIWILNSVKWRILWNIGTEPVLNILMHWWVYCKSFFLKISNCALFHWIIYKLWFSKLPFSAWYFYHQIILKLIKINDISFVFNLFTWNRGLVWFYYFLFLEVELI